MQKKKKREREQKECTPSSFSVHDSVLVFRPARQEESRPWDNLPGAHVLYAHISTRRRGCG